VHALAKEGKGEDAGPAVKVLQKADASELFLIKALKQLLWLHSFLSAMLVARVSSANTIPSNPRASISSFMMAANQEA